MDDAETIIRIKTTADNSGAESAEKALGGVENAARRMGTTAPREMGSLGSAVGGVTKAVNTLHRIMSGFGVVALVAPLVAAFKSWRESIAAVEQKLKDARQANLDASDTKAVRDMADAYAQLQDRIRETAQARQRDNELLDMEVNLRHEAEDARLNAQEANELAAVDPNSPDADKERAAIAARYGAERASNTASRKGEAIVLQRQKLAEEASDATSAADQLALTLGADDRNIIRARTKAGTLARLATMRNEKDGVWYNPYKRTDEGDAERQRLKAEADKANEEVRRLEADRAKKEKEITELRREAAQATAKRDLLGTALGTYETVSATTATQNATSVGLAEKALADQRAQRRREAEQLAANKTEMSSAQTALAAAQERLSGVKRGQFANAAALAWLETSYGSSAGGNRRQRQQAAETYKTERASIENANFELDRSENSLTEMIATLQARIRKLAASIETAEKRLRNERDTDGSEGD